jgi:hypothetical protein
MKQDFFAEEGTERLAAFEAALLAEARTRTDACSRELDKATALVANELQAKFAVGERLGQELFVEDALARSLARFEDSLLIRARSEHGSHAVHRADKTVRAMQDSSGLGRQAPGEFKADRVRPASAPLVYLRGQASESHIRIRQRAYDDRRAGRKRRDGEHAYPRPEPDSFDPDAACNHSFKPVRVRRDENGRLQPRVSGRLLRMSMPTFMGVPVEPVHAPALDWGAVVKDATDLVWTKARDVLAPSDALSQQFVEHHPSAPLIRVTRKVPHRNRPHRSDSERPPSPIKPHDHYQGMRASWSCIGKNAFGSRVVDIDLGLEKKVRRQAVRRAKMQADSSGGMRMHRSSAGDGRAPVPGGAIAGEMSEDEVQKAIAELSERLAQIRDARHSTSAPTVTTSEDTSLPGGRQLSSGERKEVDGIMTKQKPDQNLQSFAELLEEGLED